MKDWLERSALLYGEEGIIKLQQARVAVLGLGGVGSAAAEALCRSGIGAMLLVDSEQVDITNCNRQLIATQETVGHFKAEAMRKRLLSIHPHCDITIEQQFYLPENSEFVYRFSPHYIVDAIDTVTCKIHLAEQCQQRGIALYSCLGTGNRMDPSCLRLGDLTETAGTGCPLSRVMRKELRRRGIQNLSVVYSIEPPILGVTAECSIAGRNPPGSTAFVPPAAGLLLASGVVREILAQEKKE